MCYNNSVIQLYSFLKSTVRESDGPRTGVRAKEICHSCAREISSLIGIHRSKWGVDRMSLTRIQWVMRSLFALLGDLDNPCNRTAFIELCTVGRSFARNYMLPRGILRMIQITAHQMEAPLPSDVAALFRDFESESWERKDLEKLSSVYPNFATIYRPSNSAEDHEMDRFLEKWDSLCIDWPSTALPATSSV